VGAVNQQQFILKDLKLLTQQIITKLEAQPVAQLTSEQIVSEPSAMFCELKSLLGKLNLPKLDADIVAI
jgi:hypothetical protein